MDWCFGVALARSEGQIAFEIELPVIFQWQTNPTLTEDLDALRLVSYQFRGPFSAIYQLSHQPLTAILRPYFPFHPLNSDHASQRGLNSRKSSASAVGYETEDQKTREA